MTEKPENKLTDNFVEWVRKELEEHAVEVQEELRGIDPKKSLVITAKLKLKHVAGGLFKPVYLFSVPRAAVKSEDSPNQQLQLPGV